MKIEDFNALKKGDEIEHYECQNGVSFWQQGTVIERDKRNIGFILADWKNGGKRYTGRQLIRKKMDTAKLEFEKGVTYSISGDMLNGGYYEGNRFIQRIEKATVRRKIKYIDTQKGVLVCECDRRFLLNENLSVTE